MPRESNSQLMARLGRMHAKELQQMYREQFGYECRLSYSHIVEIIGQCRFKGECGPNRNQWQHWLEEIISVENRDYLGS